MFEVIKGLQIFLLFSLYFSSLNLKYLKFTKMELTRFAVKLFIYTLKYELKNISKLMKWMDCPSQNH